MKCLVDVNLLVDVVARREPWAVDATRLLDSAARLRVELFLCAATVTTLYYVVRREAADSPPERRRAALGAVDLALRAFTIVPVALDVLVAARAMPGRDFEDNVQIACAIAAGVDLIVTGDAAGFAHSPVRPVDPAEAARLIAAATPPR